MFDERTFISKKRQQWQDLNFISERVKQNGLKSLVSGDLARLGSLYRRTCSDLAYARTQRATPGLVDYLNDLVGNVHGVLYVDDQDQKSFARASVKFITTGFPALLRKRMPFVAAAFLISLAGYIFAYYLTKNNPAMVDLFFPAGMKDSMEAWKQGFADHGTVSAGEGAAFSSFLWTHNWGVGIAAFAMGITTLLPAYMMLDNGMLMGALVAVVQPTGHLSSLWPGILPHGICELSAIFICGGAGFLIGWALISPGRYSRKDALIKNAIDAVKMAVGTGPMFVIAGFFEGNVSHSGIPHLAKYFIAAVQVVLLVLYIYGKPLKAMLFPTSSVQPSSKQTLEVSTQLR